jgi:FKBP-type peptidyl-prolyl cis-trans isomerase
MAKMSEESAAAGKKFLEDNAKKAGVVTTASGLQYEVEKKAEGAQPKPTDVVTVHYTGKLTNGTVFEANWLTALKAQARLFQPTRCWYSTWNCWRSKIQPKKTPPPSNQRLL